MENKIRAFVFTLEFRGYGFDKEMAWEDACSNRCGGGSLYCPDDDNIREDPDDPVIEELQAEYE
jgi:hypothetical protein